MGSTSLNLLATLFGLQHRSLPVSTKIHLPPRILGLMVAGLLTSCGARPDSSGESDLMWVQSRADSSRYAYLEPRDLEDTFVFGANAINTSSFLSAALDTTLGPTNVKLVLNNNKLEVVGLTDESALMSFDVAKVGNQYEVDFASGGNDLTLRSLIDVAGGMNTSKTSDGFWISDGAPRTLKVQQDPDNVVVDLEHTVTQARLDRTKTRAYMDPQAKPGKVIMRLFLTRKSSLPNLDGSIKVSDGAKQGFGFFGSDTRGVNVESDKNPVQRLNLKKGPVTFYLKDVPARYQPMAQRAVLAWNKALGPDAVRVALAPADMDAGDPRFNVVRWYDGTDETIQWAGIAHMLVEPDTGLVMGGSVYIMGNKLEEIYKGIVQYSTQANARAEMRLGNARFSGRQGETPIVPFFTDTTQTFEEYMEGYYEETITHEIGHYLGLRHNFAGSTKLDDLGQSASIMDYAPRRERSNTDGPGAYDIAALQWSYFGRLPASTLPFCTDEDLDTQWDCNHGDFGNPITYFENGIKNGVRLLTSTPVPIERNVWISPIGTAINNALKISRLSYQLPESERATALAKLKGALLEVQSATPDATLSPTEKQVVQNNLSKLRQVILEEGN